MTDTIDNIITTWYLPGVGFTGYWNRYLDKITHEYTVQTVANLRAFMLAGVRETGHMELSRAIKTGRKAMLYKILASFPHAFGVKPEPEFRLAHHVI